MAPKRSTMDKRQLLTEAARSCSLDEFLEEKLKRYLKKLAKLERSNLHDAILSEVEKSLIKLVLNETVGNQLKTAKILGINRTTLRTKINKYKIRI
jgi:DNA-binding protein Fis